MRRKTGLHTHGGTRVRTKVVVGSVQTGHAPCESGIITSLHPNTSTINDESAGAEGLLAHDCDSRIGICTNRAGKAGVVAGERQRRCRRRSRREVCRPTQAATNSKAIRRGRRLEQTERGRCISSNVNGSSVIGRHIIRADHAASQKIDGIPIGYTACRNVATGTDGNARRSRPQRIDVLKLHRAAVDNHRTRKSSVWTSKLKHTCPSFREHTTATQLTASKQDFRRSTGSGRHFHRSATRTNCEDLACREVQLLVGSGIMDKAAVIERHISRPVLRGCVVRILKRTAGIHGHVARSQGANVIRDQCAAGNQGGSRACARGTERQGAGTRLCKCIRIGNECGGQSEVGTGPDIERATRSAERNCASARECRSRLQGTTVDRHTIRRRTESGIGTHAEGSTGDGDPSRERIRAAEDERSRARFV